MRSITIAAIVIAACCSLAFEACLWGTAFLVYWMKGSPDADGWLLGAALLSLALIGCWLVVAGVAGSSTHNWEG